MSRSASTRARPSSWAARPSSRPRTVRRCSAALLFHLLFIVVSGAGRTVFGDAAIGEYFRVFISYGVIAVALVMHAWSAVSKRKDPEAQLRAASEKA